MTNDSIGFIRVICEQTGLPLDEFVKDDELTKLGTLAITFVAVSFALKFAEVYTKLKGEKK